MILPYSSKNRGRFICNLKVAVFFPLNNNNVQQNIKGIRDVVLGLDKKYDAFATKMGSMESILRDMSKHLRDMDKEVSKYLFAILAFLTGIGIPIALSLIKIAFFS